jgi:NADH-quinone oxidoreductase subunit M
MVLLGLIVILLLGGLLAWAAGRWSASASRWISLIALSADFVIGLVIWIRSAGHVDLLRQQDWLRELDWNWIPTFGIHFHLALDGLSLPLLMLTFLLGIMSESAPHAEPQAIGGSYVLVALTILLLWFGVYPALLLNVMRKVLPM